MEHLKPERKEVPMNFNLFNLLRDLSDMKGEMNRIFGAHGRPARKQGAAAAVNLYESPEQYLVLMEAPGAVRDKLEITLNGQDLVIKGEIPPGVPENAELHRCERSCGEFARSVELPGRVNPAGVSASFKDGLLSVAVDKAEEQKPKQIKVQIG